MDTTLLTLVAMVAAAIATLVHVVRSNREHDIARWRKAFTVVAAPLGVALIVLVFSAWLT